MQNLRPLSGSELAQILHCVDALARRRSALPPELWTELESYRADLLAELEDRPLPRRQPGTHGRNGRCGCLCSEIHLAGNVESRVVVLRGR
jgi:hypothetical protein